ncbi:MAG: hypothetical protein U5L09_12645 [Bacteroidales bacterium]|nr:hypothetical protein [Bacteroidales bacterium]
MEFFNKSGFDLNVLANLDFTYLGGNAALTFLPGSAVANSIGGVIMPPLNL